MRVSEYIQGVTKVCVSIQESQNYTGLGIQTLYISHQKIKDGRRCRGREGPRGLEEKGQGGWKRRGLTVLGLK